MKDVVIHNNWSLIATRYARVRRALAGIYNGCATRFLVLAITMVGSSATFAQDLPDSATPGSAIWTGDSVILWGGYKGNPPVVVNSGWSLDPALGVWTRLPNTAPLSPRTDQVAVWTGKEMIVWGGDNAGGGIYFGDGARFDPSTQTWKPMSGIFAPTKRQQARAVWTGSRMLVYGGFNETLAKSFLADGRIYDPVADAWTSMSQTGAASPRRAHSAVWTGEEMIVWGGFNGVSGLNDGARYNPSIDTWQTTSISNAPSARDNFSAVWTGTEMIVWGGIGYGQAKLADGARYNPANDTWVPVSNVGAPRARRSHTAVWTGKEMLVWGGSTGPGDGFTILNDGAAYNPTTDTWHPLAMANAPSPRYGHFALWTGNQMIVLGGGNQVDVWTTAPGGGAYDPTTDRWTPITDTLSPKPAIDGEPQDQAVAIGQPATFSVVAKGAIPLAYQWYFGTNSIPGATNSTYSIPNAQLSDAGSYSAVVSNAFGIARSRFARLSVQEFPTTVEIIPASQRVRVGDIVQFNVAFGSTSSDGTVPKEELFIYQWLFAGKTFPILSSDPFYFIDNVQLCDAGEYSVVVTDRRGGHSITARAVLTVDLQTDQSVVQPQSQHIYVGQSATFSVEVHPDLSYQWRFGTNDIPGATDSFYTIPSVQFSDTGVYTVVETSPCYGPALSSTASLTVIPGIPPSATIQPVTQSVTVGDRASFKVAVKGPGPLSIQWRFGTNIIPGANDYRYAIDHVQPNNAGTYSVTVINALGSTTASAELIVTPPGPLDIWTPVKSGTTHQLNAVAMNPHTVVAVGDSGTIVTSTNGMDWVSQVSGVANNLKTIVHANGLFVAGGDAGTIITSPDGIIWTRQQSRTENTIYGLTFGNDLFVAVGASGLILTSLDAVEWIYHEFIDENGYSGIINNVAFGNGMFVATKLFGRSPFLSSLNGIDWKSYGLSPLNLGWWRADNAEDTLVFDNGYFYCFGAGFFIDSGAAFILISADGRNWWGGYLHPTQYTAGYVVGTGNGQVLVTISVAGGFANAVSEIKTADTGGLNTDRPIWDLNSIDNGSDDYLTLRNNLPDRFAGMVFWHSRFVMVGRSGAIYLSGTLPPYLSAISQSGNTTAVSVEGVPLESYVLQSASTIVGPWQSVSTNSTSPDGIVTFTDPVPPDGGSRFYRVSGP